MCVWCVCVCGFVCSFCQRTIIQSFISSFFLHLWCTGCIHFLILLSTVRSFEVASFQVSVYNFANNDFIIINNGYKLCSICWCCFNWCFLFLCSRIVCCCCLHTVFFNVHCQFDARGESSWVFFYCIDFS